MYLVINTWITAVKVSNFSGHFLRNRSTLDIGVLGYIGIVWPKEQSPEVSHIPPVTPCMFTFVYIMAYDVFVVTGVFFLRYLQVVFFSLSPLLQKCVSVRQDKLQLHDGLAMSASPSRGPNVSLSTPQWRLFPHCHRLVPLSRQPVYCMPLCRRNDWRANSECGYCWRHLITLSQSLSKHIQYYFFMWRDIPTTAKADSMLGFRVHTQTHHPQHNSSGRGISPSQRPLPNSTQHSQQKTSMPSRRDSNPQPRQASSRKPQP